MKNLKKNICFGCNSKCCKDVSITLNTPKTKKDWEEIKWLVAHKKVSVYKDNENDWLVEFKTDCEKLDKKGLCTIYSKRPIICKEHNQTICINHNDEPYYKILFQNIEDVENYLKKKNYSWLKKL